MPPILTSLLDTDAYKLHMQQAVYHRYPDAEVVAEFHSRNEEDLLPMMGQIEKQLRLAGSLRLSKAESLFLAERPFFSADYLDHLRRKPLDASLLRVFERDGRINVRVEGPWQDVILWEIPVLATISEMRNRFRYPQLGVSQALTRLDQKIDKLQDTLSPEEMQDFNLIDFGTRRRFSQAVQDAVVGRLKERLPCFRGTSNYQLAQKYQLPAVGTQAHEWFQAHQQLGFPLAQSQRAALTSWLDEFSSHLGIALTDCITMDAFLHDFDFELASRYQGLRHDSGDPVVWGEKAISHYQRLGINPASKTLVFSDGLNLDKAVALFRHFRGRINTSFGIGTQLTCDLPGVSPMNIVFKLMECNGGPVAKISDSPGKTLCRDADFVRHLKQAFHLPR
ncbi:nicotinate phosphoribosyltransferase [Aeromonas molluscorum]|uniref:Nicotinate phosphoribosyltransferase n=1 Tax=Aeromonas molluscorum 848 TaxID=1268236 RepID=R1GTR3_9GAMM|nr:nicotinate phosphoribosyltransferase [Aeromonas molluscorum]EOD55005.1 nicotinate phosphoribosyltransferase [Aeromonas molluscorum 848]